MDYAAAFNERPEYILNLANARSQILQKFKQFKFDFFSTSIYNVYSIVKMISKGLMVNIPKYSGVFDALDEFATHYDIQQMALFDNTGLIIADCIHHTETFNQNEFDKIISNHLKYYAACECQKITDFKPVVQKTGAYMNVSYQFKLDGTNSSIEQKSYYISIISKIRDMDWKIDQTIEKIRELLKTIGA